MSSGPAGGGYGSNLLARTTRVTPQKLDEGSSWNITDDSVCCDACVNRRLTLPTVAPCLIFGEQAGCQSFEVLCLVDGDSDEEDRSAFVCMLRRYDLQRA